MERLRIGFFSWESLHSIRVGGISPHVSELAETLARAGHEVHIFTRRGDQSEYDFINGVHYQRVDWDYGGSIVHQMDSMSDAMVDRFRAVESIFGRFDVIHGHDWHPVKALKRIKEEFGREFVLTFHSTEWGRNGNRHGGWPEAREISHREWLGGYEAREIIATTREFKNELEYVYQIPDYKINVVYNGIFPGKIEKKVDAGVVKSRLGIHPFAPVILFTGRMSYQKGPDLLVRAVPLVLRKRWDAHFVFIGEGDMRSYCERLSWQSGARSKVHFLGYASDEVLRDWMNACDMVCMPSRNEPFGIVALESWDASKPVIGTNAVNLIENFSNGIRGYIDPFSIAWCINYAMGGDYARLGRNGKKLVNTRYNWNNIARQTLEVYNKLTD